MNNKDKQGLKQQVRSDVRDNPKRKDLSRNDFIDFYNELFYYDIMDAKDSDESMDKIEKEMGVVVGQVYDELNESVGMRGMIRESLRKHLVEMEDSSYVTIYLDEGGENLSVTDEEFTKLEDAGIIIQKDVWVYQSLNDVIQELGYRLKPNYTGLKKKIT